MSTLTDYRLVARDITRWQKFTSSKPDVALAVKYYQSNIGKVKSIDDLLKNDRLFAFAMNAYGLGDRLYAKGLIKQVLQQGMGGATTLANRLNDPRIKDFARAFNFVVYGSGTTQTVAVQSDTVTRFVEQTLEIEQGKSNPGVQLALYFRQNASKLTNSYGILADKNLLTVVQTALGLSPYTSYQNIDVQAKTIDAKLKIADFQDSKKLNGFIQKFCAMYDANNTSGSSGSASASPTMALYDSGSSTTEIASSAQLTLQNLRINGH